MKKLLFVLGMFAIFSFISCSKDDDNDSKSTNSYFTYSGQKYALSKGYLVYYCQESSSVYCHELTICSSGITATSTNFMGIGDYVCLDIYTSSKTELPVGTYHFSSTITQAGYVAYGEIDMGVNIQEFGEDDNYVPFASGTMTVSKSGSVYTITVTGKDENSNEIYATYTGSLTYYDDSKNSECLLFYNGVQKPFQKTGRNRKAI